MLNQSVGYAIYALSLVAAAGGRRLLVSEVSTSSGIPKHYLAKIMGTLTRKGFLSAQRGIGGGVVLSRDPGSVSLHEICVALDDPIVMERCLLGVALCSDERSCPCHSFWKVHRAQIVDFLKGTTLQDLAEFEKGTSTEWYFELAKGPLSDMEGRKC